MDGYTVEEAASVLGVPRERVWELLARGVIAGSTDLGGGMRVRLKADPPPEPSVVPLERAAEAGPGASADLTPFRELLTEFRSLTERYGQALLALGEARGEVAGLRSRVDMLEARVDLRLPSGAAPISSSWSATPWPIPTERVVEPPSAKSAAAARSEEPATATQDEQPGAPAAHDDESGSHRRRGRGGRRATESFADALARAQDPSIPELPGAAETAAALAAMRHDHPSEAARAPELETPDRDADASLPRELPSADHVLVADEAQPVAESDASARAEAAATVEKEDAGPAAAAPAVDTESGPPEAGSVEPTEDSIAAPRAEPATEPAAEREVEVEVAPEAAPQAATAAERGGPDGDSDAELAWDPERYSAAIEEPGWISADEVAVAPPAWSPPPAAAPPPDAAAEEPRESVTDDSSSVTRSQAPQRPVAERATSTAIAIESSGSRELDEGLAALDALAHPEPPARESAEDGPEADSGARSGGMERAAHAIGAPRPQSWVRSSPPPLATRSSASRAYRRLRRIFPT